MDEHTHQHGSATAETAIDPVCEMTVDPRTARSVEHDGKSYYFCSEGCRTKFLADPAKYLNRKPFVLPPRKPPATITHEHHDHAHHGHGHDRVAIPSPQGGEGGRRPDEGAFSTHPKHLRYQTYRPQTPEPPGLSAFISPTYRRALDLW